MDMWLTQQELDELCGIANTKSREYDAHWEALKRERKPILDFDKTVKTKTPTLLDFDKHFSFTYRRYDGAHWHTELRNIDTEIAPALNSKQHKLKDSLDTLLLLSHNTQRLKWYTPITENGSYDPLYQLIKTANNKWYCYIGDSVYEVSNSKLREDRGYTQYTFSTTQKPVFTQEAVDDLLDQLLQTPKENKNGKV